MIAITVFLEAHPEHTDALLAEIVENAGHSRKEPGCRKWEYSRHLQDPLKFCLYEVYDDVAAMESHLASPHVKRWMEEAPKYFAAKTAGRFDIIGLDAR